MFEDIPEWRKENRIRAGTMIFCALVFTFIGIWYVWTFNDLIESYLTGPELYSFFIVLGSVYGFLLGLLAVKIWPDQILTVFTNQDNTFIHLEKSYNDNE